MRHSGEVLSLLNKEDAENMVKTINKKLPEFRKDLTLHVEGNYAVIMTNIGYNQYEVKAVYIDMRSK